MVMQAAPEILSKPEIEGMRVAGNLAAACLSNVRDLVFQGIETQIIDDYVRGFCDEHGCIPATLGYEGFPAACCVSINHVVAHGIPGARKLRNGDIVKVDIALSKDGWFGDTCATFAVGRIPVKSQAIIEAAQIALLRGIEAVKPGGHVGDIGDAIYTYIADETPFSVVEEFGGHGIGREFHMLPFVPNCGVRNKGVRLEPGMCLTIEPMVNAGLRFVKVLKDGSIVTRDRERSAQFEHTVLVTDHGCEVLTS